MCLLRARAFFQLERYPYMSDRVGQQLGHYRLLRVLGQGAFAEVYLAEHLYLERLAAIKVLPVQMDSETQERFLREARARFPQCSSWRPCEHRGFLRKI